MTTDRSGLSRFLWLPVPVALAVILGLWAADLRTAHESRAVMVLLNFFCTWLASFAICVLTARGFLASGQPGLLMFGCGSLVWGITSLAAAAEVPRLNATITIHNVGMLVAALCHFSGLLWRGRLARPGVWLAACYAAGLGVAALIFWAAMSGLTPTFFVQGQGGTPVRQAVLALSVLLFGAVAWRLLRRAHGQEGAFYSWYGWGLALVASGLAGVFLLTVQASILGWVNRLTQYLGSAYLLVAAAVALRTMGASISLDLAQWDDRLLRLLTPQRLWSLPGLYRYSLAIGLVGVATMLRVVATPWLGTVAAFNLFLLAAVVVTVLLGIGPGLLAVVLGNVAVEIFVLGVLPVLFAPATLLQLGLSVAIGASVCAVLHGIRVAAIKAQQNAARLTAFGEASFEGIVESESGRIVDCNEQFARIAGATVAELRGTRIVDLIAPEDRARVQTNIQPNRESVIEHGVLRQDGTRLVVEAHGRPVAPASARRHTAVRDITGRKRAEDALRDREDRLRLAVSAAELGVFEWNIATDTAIWENDRMYEIFGLPPGSEAVNRKRFLQEVIIPADLPRFERDLGDSMRAAGLFLGSYRIRRVKDGELRWIEYFSRFATGPGGEVVRLLGVLEDITERRQAEEALRVSEEKYRDLFANMAEEVHFWHLVRDPSGAIQTWRLVDANPPTLKTWGRQSIDEIRGKTTDEIFGPGATEHFLPVVQKIMTEGVPHSYEDFFPNLGRHFRFTSVPLGEYFITTGADITAIKKAQQELSIQADELVRSRKAAVNLARDATAARTAVEQAAAALRVSEARYRQVVENTSAIILRVAPSGVITFANGRALEFFGYTADELIGEYAVGTIIPPSESSGRNLGAMVEEIAREPDRFHTNANENTCKDGRRVWVEWTNSGIYDTDNRLEEFLAVGIDATQRKQTEAALSAAKQQLDAHMDNSPLAVIEWGPDMRLTRWSHEAERMFGWKAEEVLGKRMEEFGWIYTEDVAHVAGVPADLRTGANPTRFSLNRNFTKDGAVLWCEWYNSSLPDESGELRSILSLVLDITERRRADEKLKEALHEKEVLLKEVHHRVKNNMQVLSSLVSLQSDGVEDPATRDLLGDFRDQVRTMALVHESLYQSESLAHINFAEYASGLTAYLARAHGHENSAVRLTLDVEPVSLPIESAVPCGLILNELVTNAYKHAFRDRPAGEIVVRLRADSAGRVSLAVRDDGKGMPADLDWRHAPSLGLRLVQMLTRQVRGAVEWRQPEGGGTEFVVEFPGKPG
jgi:PAS domain S-box-containing protein